MSLIPRIAYTVAGAATGAVVDGLLQSEREEDFNKDRFALAVLTGAAAGFFIPLLYRWKFPAVPEISTRAMPPMDVRATKGRYDSLDQNLKALEARIAEGTDFFQLRSRLVSAGGRARPVIDEMEGIRNKVKGLRTAFDKLGDARPNRAVGKLLGGVRTTNHEVDEVIQRGQRFLADAARPIGGEVVKQGGNGAKASAVRRTVESLPDDHPTIVVLERCRSFVSQGWRMTGPESEFAAAQVRLESFIAESASRPGWRQPAEQLRQRFRDVRARLGDYEARFQAIAASEQKPRVARTSLERLEKEMGGLDRTIDNLASGVDQQIAEIRRRRPEGSLEVVERFAAELAEARSSAAAAVSAQAPAAPTLARAARPPTPARPADPWNLMVEANRGDLHRRVYSLPRDGSTKVLFNGRGCSSLEAKWTSRPGLLMIFDPVAANAGPEALNAVKSAFTLYGAKVNVFPTSGRDYLIAEWAEYEVTTERLYYLFRRLAESLRVYQ